MGLFKKREETGLDENKKELGLERKGEFSVIYHVWRFCTFDIYTFGVLTLRLVVQGHPSGGMLLGM